MSGLLVALLVSTILCLVIGVSWAVDDVYDGVIKTVEMVERLERLAGKNLDAISRLENLQRRNNEKKM